MDANTQQTLQGYLDLLAVIKEKTGDERTAVAVLTEVNKDRRMSEMKQERVNSGNELATEKQKEFMKKLGIKVPKNLTKHEASALIDEELGKTAE